ncbi:MAG: putative Leucine-rich repeat domain protein [Promethearchaeota archaeon]|nr:MAG: putative Leucine-rich repeat domain protein [Candidatus Lokiarchaeota archaeon]
MELNLNKLFEDYKNNHITDSMFIESLSTIVDTSKDVQLRKRILRFLGRSGLDEGKIFNYLERILVSDSEEILRNLAADIIKSKFLKRSYKPMRFTLEHECSPICLETIHETLVKYIQNLPEDEMSKKDTEAFLFKEVQEIEEKDFKIGFENILSTQNEQSLSIRSLKEIMVNYFTYVYLKKVFWRIKIKIKHCKIIELDFLFKSIKEIPDQIKLLKDLKYLILRYNKLEKIPKWIGSLDSLVVLNINVNSLVQLPESISKLKSLQKLSLWKNRLTNLPESLGELNSLEELNLRLNYLKALPDSLGKLKNLSELNLHDNKLDHIPESIGYCSRLKDLNLSWNYLTHLPDTLGSLINLEVLDLGKNKLKYIPKTLMHLKSLRRINLSENYISRLPKEISSLSSLEYLNLSRNKLSSIPKEILELESLKELYIGDNEFNHSNGIFEKLTKRGVHVYN